LAGAFAVAAVVFGGVAVDAGAVEAAFAGAFGFSGVFGLAGDFAFAFGFAGEAARNSSRAASTTWRR
jgi:hypothetical protein